MRTFLLQRRRARNLKSYGGQGLVVFNPFTSFYRTPEFYYRRELERLLKKNSEELEPYSTALAKAEEDKETVIVIQNHLNAWSLQRKKNRDRLAVLETEYLLGIARRNLVPTPEMTTNDMLGKPEPGSRWRLAEESHDMMLNREGREELLRAIHADRRERLERWRLWIATVVPGLTGLIGVLIGLLAVILGRR
jgi:hypothetical protein